MMKKIILDTELGTKNNKSPDFSELSVPRAGLEPAHPQWIQDFKSCVSTNSTTKASLYLQKKAIFQLPPVAERETRLEPATPTLARSCSTN